MKKSPFFHEKNTEYSKAKVVILPIQFEYSTSFIKGTRYAPLEILKYSSQLEVLDEDYLIETLNIFPIHTTPIISYKNPQEMITKLSKKIKKIIHDKKFPVVIGGEHTITIGVLEGIKEVYGNNIKIIQFDAHADLRNIYQNKKYSHACTMRRIIERGFSIVGCGIRAFSYEEYDFLTKNSEKYKLLRNYIEIEKFFKQISSEKIYLTLDTDVLDPSVLPAVGTPEPEGLTYSQLLNLLDLLIRNNILLGFDIVEFCPIKGLIWPQYMISKLLYRILSAITKYSSVNKQKS